ncbi:MAG TPA: DCC1-like thiol-disulfide oxidoreductase family protein [Leptospiraceae bacterium]|nr:DCC1-like thiol-disulfide oxidoreductase family protein [Leptospiraceae bacterium]HMY69195.1 DCC1-like thiol-disulfide oxidoreductase family protein [Leptospiraceae bacterium]HNF13538.1 DCC1-like thiol-disulfide oxidoreductase family protein [Leptospiraceae bacterium]HNF28638.1 DCC1-like thiol-disulfide oxidoreductase family protein [Leptospiraceae bacterium]HNI96247.1 DCC1-like thiol-disulfide oxidoreductase family protein [Leptospiraceae bacterium]
MKNEIIFFYDGNCSFCRRSAEKLKKLDSENKIEFAPFREWDEKSLKDLHSELTLEKLESEFQLVFNGKRFPGFFAVRKILPFLRGWKYLTPLLYLPLVPFLGMAVIHFLGRKYHMQDR